MQYNSFHIVSTRPLDQSLVQRAAESNIIIELLSLITTEPVAGDTLKVQIAELAARPLSVAITSINAAKAVAACLPEPPADWNIFTVGTATREYVSKQFGGHSIAGTAENASALADVIIAAQEHNMIYFCGNQRRDELPQMLAASGVQVQEIVVYRTVYTAVKTGTAYDGILFFSPGAVQSFFLVNTVPERAVLFAIGTTTAATIGTYSNNPVVISELASAEALVQKTISYFANSNQFHEGITE